MAGNLTIDTLTTGNGASISTTNIVNGSAKAWVNFDGTTGAVRASFNIGSVTRVGGGSYDLTFVTPMSDANYSISCGGRTTNTTDPRIAISFGSTVTTAPSTTGFSLFSSINNIGGEVTSVCCSIYR